MGLRFRLPLTQQLRFGVFREGSSRKCLHWRGNFSPANFCEICRRKNHLRAQKSTKQSSAQRFLNDPFPKTPFSAADLQGSKTPKSGKEGFGVKKPPFPPTPEKGVSSQKIPISKQGTTGEMGIFLTRDALFWGGGKWGFFDSETLFSRFWGF